MSFLSKQTAPISPVVDTNIDDIFFLNGKIHPLTSRMSRCIHSMRKEALRVYGPDESHVLGAILIESTNSFPTAAVLASSASGISALVYALWKLYRLDECGRLSAPMLTSIALLGFGSASRSIPVGFVQWHKGYASDDSCAISVSSFSEQISEPWDYLVILVYIFSSSRKQISSTEGMKRTVTTSQLYSHRLSSVLPDRIKELKRGIAERDKSSLFRIAMQDSNNFHACCMDSFPPILCI